MANLIERKGQSSGLLLAGLAVLTLALVIGIRMFMRDDTAAGAGQPAEQQLFKEPAAAPPPGLNPAGRSESSGSGAGLEMFSKTNAGYYGAEESTAAAAAQKTAPEVRKSTAAAARKAAAAKPKGTVIPRLKPYNMGTFSQGNAPQRGAGQGMPDISGMLKQAQEQAGKNNPSGN